MLRGPGQAPPPKTPAGRGLATGQACLCGGVVSVADELDAAAIVAGVERHNGTSQHRSWRLHREAAAAIPAAPQWSVARPDPSEPACPCGGSLAERDHGDSLRHRNLEYRDFLDEPRILIDVDAAAVDLAADPEFREWAAREHGPFGFGR
jgi:hypothetical protein